MIFKITYNKKSYLKISIKKLFVLLPSNYYNNKMVSLTRNRIPIENMSSIQFNIFMFEIDLTIYKKVKNENI